jgi:hypothetical protein
MIPQMSYALVNSAVDEILARFALLKDVTGTENIFKSAERGAILIQENVTPSNAQLPALRAWYGSTEYNMGASDFVMIAGRDGKGGIQKEIDFDVYLYSFDKDEDGNFVDLQADLLNIEQAMMMWLQDYAGGQPLEGSPNIFVHSQGNVKWYFTWSQVVKGSHGTVMRRFGGTHVLPPPWYTTTLTLKIDIWPYSIASV